MTSIFFLSLKCNNMLCQKKSCFINIKFVFFPPYRFHILFFSLYCSHRPAQCSYPRRGCTGNTIRCKLSSSSDTFSCPLSSPLLSNPFSLFSFVPPLLFSPSTPPLFPLSFTLYHPLLSPTSPFSPTIHPPGES